MFPTASSLSDTFQNKMTTSSHFQNVQHTYCRWNNKKNNSQCYNFLRTYTFSRHSPWHFPSPPGDDVRWLSVASLTELLVENTGGKNKRCVRKSGRDVSVALGCGWRLAAVREPSGGGWTPARSHALYPQWKARAPRDRRGVTLWQRPVWFIKVKLQFRSLVWCTCLIYPG